LLELNHDFSTYFELLSNLLSDGFFELFEPIRPDFRLIVMEVLVTELIQNGILDVLVLEKEEGK
jgi:hypothetical protein